METSHSHFGHPAAALLPTTPLSERFDAGAAATLCAKWLALHDAGEVVAQLAGRPFEPAASEFPEALSRASGWRLALGRQGLDDLAAILESGLAALLALTARGGNPGVAAQALWDEFVAAREALVALAPQAAEPSS